MTNTTYLGGLEKYRAKLRHLKASVRGERLAKAVLAGGFVIETHTKLNIQRQGLVDKGNLVGSPATELESSSSNTATAKVSLNPVYAAIHEFGGTIKPVLKAALTFQTKDGEWHTVGSVTIPARPYLRPAIDDHHDDILAAIVAQLSPEMERDA